jgi:hypothetical protein
MSMERMFGAASAMRSKARLSGALAFPSIFEIVNGTFLEFAGLCEALAGRP